MQTSSKPIGVKQDKRPLVVLQKIRGTPTLAHCDQRGLDLGLTRGLSLADARARIPDLIALEAHPDADHRVILKLAILCDRFTPLVAIDPPYGLVLDVSGCAHLFGGEAKLRSSICALIGRLGFTVKAVVAGTPDAAHALARFSRIEISPSGSDEAMTRPLPIAALEADGDIQLALKRAGLRTLGDLADRPSTALVARFGSDLTRRLARTLGREDRRITPLRTPPVCMVQEHFAEPLFHARALEISLLRLVNEACRILEQRGEGGRAFVTRLFRTDGAVKRIVVETGRPSRSAAAIMRLYRERLDTLSDPIEAGLGYDTIRLAVPVSEMTSMAQSDLDGTILEDSAVAELIDRLVVRFGHDRVLRFTAVDSHHPDKEARCHSASNPPTAKNKGPAGVKIITWPKPALGEPPTRPIQLFDPPQPIEVLAEVPDGPPHRFRWRSVLHEIRRAEGPERIAPEWWHDGPTEATRDYYRIEDTAGRRFWVFRLGLYGIETHEPRWFLHGLFA